eukprot:CAMPEP_0114979686 /NCGR_PEP_ID=MMETSP0216-20121206/4522_1 /TAXON_ID=223996 /ORGANISM="Protocruzia adherens, Strain Boccale" /LENGTH=104 /DNA_ID=CAMNT_0002341065 /DNA_START=1785 /DNA_END=2099 /DNA_ORIENTATION=+
MVKWVSISYFALFYLNLSTLIALAGVFEIVEGYYTYVVPTLIDPSCEYSGIGPLVIILMAIDVIATIFVPLKEYRKQKRQKDQEESLLEEDFNDSERAGLYESV